MTTYQYFLSSGSKNLADAFIRCQHNVAFNVITVDDGNALTVYVHDHKSPNHGHFMIVVQYQITSLFDQFQYWISICLAFLPII